MGKTADASAFVGRACTWENCGSAGNQAAVVMQWPGYDITSPGAAAPYCEAHAVMAQVAGAKEIGRIPHEEIESRESNLELAQ